MKQRFLQGAAYSTGSMLYSTLTLLVAGKLLTNALSLEAVGHVALLLLLGELLGTCCNLGLVATLPKLLPACDEAQRTALLAALQPFQWIVTLSLAGLCAVVVALHPWWRDTAASVLPLPQHLLALAPVLVIVVTLRDFLLAATAGLHAYGRRAGAIMLMSTLQATSFAVLYISGTGQATHYALAYIAAGAAGVTLLALGMPRGTRLNFALAWEQVRFSAPLFANSLLGFAYQRLDTLIVAHVLGIGAVGIFEMAKRIPGVLARFLGAGLVPYLPSIAGLLRESGIGGADRLLQRASSYTAFTGYFATLVVVAIQEPLLAILFTANYQSAAPAIGPLLIAACLATQAGLMGQALIALDRPATVMYINLGLAALGIGLNLILVPRFGLAGAGWSAAAAAGFSYVTQRAAVRRSGLALGMHRGELVHLYFMIAYVATWRIGSTQSALISAACFAVACFASGCVSLKELQSMLRKEAEA